MRNIFTVFGICLAVSAFAYEGTDLQSTDKGTDEYFEKIMEQVCPDTLDIAKEIQEEQGISLQAEGSNRPTSHHHSDRVVRAPDVCHDPLSYSKCLACSESVVWLSRVGCCCR